MKPVDYKCKNCSHIFELIFSDSEEIPAMGICPECGHDGRRVYTPLASICHQGRAGNYRNGYTSNPVKIKKT
jgi:putative FmdB family regulatory protein